jgi:alpha-glucosidase
LRFWLDLGVDGFRIDVAHGLVKEDLLKDHPDPQGLSDALRLDMPMDHDRRYALLPTVPFFDRQGVHEIYRQWRKIFDSYKDREVMAVAEAWVHPPINATRYVRPDELHQVFNFDLLDAKFEGEHLFGLIDSAISLMGSVGALPTWALSNHDSPRVASRVGEQQSRALALFVLGLPGSCYVYAGQELGLPDGVIPDESRQDPIYFRTKGVQKGRDGARVPLPWNGDSAPFGFTTGTPWLPLQDSWKNLTVEVQEGDGKSTLNLYRNALQLRTDHFVTAGDISWVQSPTHGDKDSELLGYTRGNVTVVMNTGSTPKEIELTGKFLIVSNGVVDSRDGKVVIPAISTVWVLH